MTSGSNSSRPNPGVSRTVGMAMLGSSIALATIGVATYSGLLPVDHSVRGWMAAGLALAAVLDAVIGLHFLRASSQS